MCTAACTWPDQRRMRPNVSRRRLRCKHTLFAQNVSLQGCGTAKPHTHAYIVPCAMQVYQLMKEQLGVDRSLDDMHPEVQLDASDDEEEGEEEGAQKAASGTWEDASNVDLSNLMGGAGGEAHDEL